MTKDAMSLIWSSKMAEELTALASQLTEASRRLSALAALCSQTQDGAPPAVDADCAHCRNWKSFDERAAYWLGRCAAWPGSITCYDRHCERFVPRQR